MFRFWRRLRGRERNIFKFDDGVRIRRADPLLLARLLACHPKYLPDHLSQAESGNPAAIAVVAQTACDVFGVEPYDDKTGRGMTEAERFHLMLAFDQYLYALKKNTRRLRTLQRSTAESTSSGSKRTTTKDSSPSGAPTSGVSPDKPKPSAEASQPVPTGSWGEHGSTP